MNVAAQPPTVKGWCPGALRPMPSGDGLIVRVKVPGGEFDVATLRAVARLGRRCGNGAFDLSHRANLQMRGVCDATLPEVHEELARLGLLLPDAGAEQVVNVVAPPLAGFDPTAVLDASALVASLERLLREDESLHALPGKFGFSIDDGGALSTTGVDVDIALEAVRIDEHRAIALRLAGAGELAALVASSAAVSAAGELARAFISLRAHGGARRMRALVEREGANRLFLAAGLSCARHPRRAPGRPGDALGPHLAGGLAFVGCAAPFGRWRAEQLEAVAGLVERAGGSALRLTPWRAIVAPGLAPERARALLDELAREKLIVGAADPRTGIVACPGAPECPSASVYTHALAEELLPLIDASVARPLVHVSGCAKGCAHPRPARFTLAGRDGRFDLVENGAPNAAPSLTGLDAAAARCAIAARMPDNAPT